MDNTLKAGGRMKLDNAPKGYSAPKYLTIAQTPEFQRQAAEIWLSVKALKELKNGIPKKSS